MRNVSTKFKQHHSAKSIPCIPMNWFVQSSKCLSEENVDTSKVRIMNAKYLIMAVRPSPNHPFSKQDPTCVFYISPALGLSEVECMIVLLL